MFCGLEARVDGLGLQREYGEDRLVYLPRRRVLDERGERLDAEAVLALGELPFLAQVTIAQHIERLGVVGAVDDAQVLAAADFQARLDPAVGQVGWLDHGSLASG